MTARGNLRGKSGLHEARVPGNARRGQPQGKRHREETAPACRGDGETVGQEPTADLATGTARQAPPGAMPNRGLARGRSGNRYRRRDASAREARVGSWTPPVTAGREEWSSRGATLGQNPAYRPSAQLSGRPGNRSFQKLRTEAFKGFDAISSKKSPTAQIDRAQAVSLLTPPRRWLKGGLQGFSGETHVSLWQERRLWRSRRRSRSV